MSVDCILSRYSLSSDLNPGWGKEYATREEIFGYWKDLVTKYKLADHIRFNRTVDECTWDSTKEVYHIKLSDSSSGSVTQVEESARVVISAVGGFLDPQTAPGLPGRDVFKGSMWHSARWNHDVSLSGKKVAVIGNGCSAVQIIPNISKDESVEIVNFCRTPQWIVPLVIARIFSTLHSLIFPS